MHCEELQQKLFCFQCLETAILAGNVTTQLFSRGQIPGIIKYLLWTLLNTKSQKELYFDHVLTLKSSSGSRQM